MDIKVEGLIGSLLPLVEQKGKKENKIYLKSYLTNETTFYYAAILTRHEITISITALHLRHEQTTLASFWK